MLTTTKAREQGNHALLYIVDARALAKRQSGAHTQGSQSINQQTWTLRCRFYCFVPMTLKYRSVARTHEAKSNTGRCKIGFVFASADTPISRGHFCSARERREWKAPKERNSQLQTLYYTFCSRCYSSSNCLQNAPTMIETRVTQFSLSRLGSRLSFDLGAARRGRMEAER